MDTFADNKFKVPQKLKLVEGSSEIPEKEQNATYPHFLPFQQCFQKPAFSGLLKVGIM